MMQFVIGVIERIDLQTSDRLSLTAWSVFYITGDKQHNIK